MGKKEILSAMAAGCAILLACDFSFLSPEPSAIPTSTPTETITSTVTPSLTATSFPTRTSSPTLIPGIEEPVQVGDASLLITKALRRETFRCGTDSTPADDPQLEEFLIILFKVIKGPSLTSARVEAWITKNRIEWITLSSMTRDGHGRAGNARHLCTSRDPDSYILTEIHLAFLIDKKAEIFTLSLPDGTAIPLDSLMPS